MGVDNRIKHPSNRVIKIVAAIKQLLTTLVKLGVVCEYDKYRILFTLNQAIILHEIETKNRS